VYRVKAEHSHNIGLIWIATYIHFHNKIHLHVYGKVLEHKEKIISNTYKKKSTNLNVNMGLVFAIWIILRLFSERLHNNVLIKFNLPAPHIFL